MKTYSISRDHIRALNYSVLDADDAGIHKHPQLDMGDLGIGWIRAIPESIGDCWIILTDYQGDLPDYISEVPIYKDYWQHWGVILEE